MEVINDLDINGKLKIIQETQKNSFTFDSVLLASFTNLRKKDNNIIDLCSGNAPIAMLLTLKKEQLNIKAIEIQEDISNLGKKSISLNKLDEKVQMINKDLINISNEIGKNYYDVITCNPPYFRVDTTSNLNESSSISIARHEIKVTLEDIIKEAKKLLNNVGTLNMVHRPDRLDEIIVLLNKYGFTINRIQFVYPKAGKEANTLLIEAKKTKVQNNKMKVLEPIFVYTNDNKYTNQAKEIMDIK